MKQIKLVGKAVAMLFTVVMATAVYAEPPAPTTGKNETKRPNIVGQL
jgi:hypothetical protein